MELHYSTNKGMLKIMQGKSQHSIPSPLTCTRNVLWLFPSLKKETADGWNLVLVMTEVERALSSCSLLNIFIFFYLITALTLGGVEKTWTMRQRQTQWCHHRGNDLVGQMGLSMVSVGNMVRALQGHGWGMVAAPAPDLGQLSLLCRTFPA